MLFRHDSWLSRSFSKMSQGDPRGSLVRIPKRIKIKEKTTLGYSLAKQLQKILTGEREFGRVLLRARSGKKGRLKNLPESEGKKSLKSDDTPTK